jgi:hypothetical protein
LGGETAGAAAEGTLKATLVKISAALVGIGLVGGGLYLTQRPEEAPAPAPVVAPAVKPAVAPAVEAPAEPESALPAPPQTDPAQKKAPAPSRSADSLSQEVAILSRASSELHAGRPAAALKALDEHQRSFPSGVLTQERTAARIQALCALGRTKEARSALERLARTAPNSPHEARARKACGFGQAGE